LKIWHEIDQGRPLLFQGIKQAFRLNSVCIRGYRQDINLKKLEGLEGAQIAWSFGKDNPAFFEVEL
jgi:hypothetical protein